jgi:uncharacterized protein (TIGR02646 family)
MRRVHRPALPGRVQNYLDRRSATVSPAGVERAWKAARQTRALATVVATLQSMMGPRQRCMYCVDSHGSDIEHFWPKATYPERAFRWPNMLLCCTECGRFKGDRFPLSNVGQPMLVDPSVEDPWEHLDFDPDTGNLTARYDATAGAPSPKGQRTVEILRLDRREGMAAGYQKTYRRIVGLVRKALEQDAVDTRRLAQALRQADDHGLLGWCFGPVGRRLQPFAELCRRVPDAWEACTARMD